jgi:predicted TIM-barrel fold metal-dependent hydrolase
VSAEFLNVAETGTIVIPKIVSVDDHIIEPPDVFAGRLERKFQDRAPHVERRRVRGISVDGVASGFKYEYGDDGVPTDLWFFENLVYGYTKVSVLMQDSSNQPSDRTLEGVLFEDMRPGCYDPKARLLDMDANGVERSLCFPQMPRFCGQIFLNETTDRALGAACVRAYNDWIVESWCGDSGGRLIPLCIIPLWDAELAAAEVRRNAARGARAVAFSEIPSHLGLPSIHSRFWDPFFAACEETGTVVCMHIGSSSKMPLTSSDAPGSVGVTLMFNNAMASLTDFLFSGVFIRYPNLKVAYSEGQIGWLPYVLERADIVWKTQSAWAGGPELPEPPSYYYYRNVYGCFFQDKHGIESLAKVGPRNVTFETDYPHADGTWPNSPAVVAEMLAGLPADDIYRLVRGNALEMLGLEDTTL